MCHAGHQTCWAACQSMASPHLLSKAKSFVCPAISLLPFRCHRWMPRPPHLDCLARQPFLRHLRRSYCAQYRPLLLLGACETSPLLHQLPTQYFPPLSPWPAPRHQRPVGYQHSASWPFRSSAHHLCSVPLLLQLLHQCQSLLLCWTKSTGYQARNNCSDQF